MKGGRAIRFTSCASAWPGEGSRGGRKGGVGGGVDVEVLGTGQSAAAMGLCVERGGTLGTQTEAQGKRRLRGLGCDWRGQVSEL